jgi:hypothetical protein
MKKLNASPQSVLKKECGQDFYIEVIVKKCPRAHNSGKNNPSGNSLS